jgi:flagellar hook-associated protein 1 FlgK
MIHSLHVAQSGLIASKTSVENVMNNISNENTPGYKKRVVELSEAEHVDSRTFGRGVSVGDTKRITNMYMYDNLMKENSKESYYGELTTMLGDIESIFYETDTSGFSSDLDRYFQA